MPEELTLSDVQRARQRIASCVRRTPLVPSATLSEHLKTNVYVKLGGIGMPRTGFDWHARNTPIGSEELAATMAPFMTYCIEQFGPSRSMFESNFPVDKVSFSYCVMYNAFKRLSKAYSAAERAAMFHDTATRVYRIGV